MEVTVALPTTPVALPPGAETRVPVELSGPAQAARSVRVTVAGGRAARWASVEPETLALDAGASTTVELVLRVPGDVPPSGALLPFTVQVSDAATGAPAGWGSGLLTVAVPVPLTAELVTGTGPADRFDLLLGNQGTDVLELQLTAELDPPAGDIQVTPARVQVGPGDAVTAGVRARPRRSLLGTPAPYAVIVAVHDAATERSAPLLTTTAGGTRKPWLSSRAATVLAVAVLLAASVAVFLSNVRLPLPGRSPVASATSPAAPVAAPPATPVKRPFALIEVFPHRGPDGGRSSAETERSRLTAAGMPVRIVDSLTSDDLADDGAGFWVLLQDGFASAAEVDSFCGRWRAVAPKCTLTP